MSSARSHRLEARDALGPEGLHGVGLELVVAGEAVVEANHALRFALGHDADQLQRQFALKADEQRPACHTVNHLARQGERLYRRGEREAALEQDLAQQVVSRSAPADMVHVQVELPLKRLGILRRVGVPGVEIGLGELENAKAAVRLLRALQVELAGVLVAELLDDAAHAFLADIGNGGVVLAARGFRKLNEDEFALTTVLLVQIDDSMGGGPRASEEVQDGACFSYSDLHEVSQ